MCLCVSGFYSLDIGFRSRSRQRTCSTGLMLGIRLCEGFGGIHLCKRTGGATFAPDCAVIGGSGAPLSTGGEVVVGLS